MIHEILKPVEGEILSSWIIRSIVAHNAVDTVLSCKRSAEDLIGKKAGNPDLHWVKNHDYFFNNDIMSKVKYFANEKRVIEDMTVLPFYKGFTENNEVVCNFKDYRNYYNENKIGLYNYQGGAKLIFLCLECIKEAQNIVAFKEQ